jgi:cytochrome b561
MSVHNRYTAVARWLHWAIAGLIVANIVIGILHAYVNHDWPVIPLHKSIGLTVLALTVLRILWRATHAAPPLPAAMPRWEQAAAHGLHGLFYALMLALPVTGWVMVSAGDKPLRWFGLFPLPKLAVSKADAVFGLSHASHGPLGLVFGALILLHVAAALRHHLVLRDRVLARMLA